MIIYNITIKVAWPVHAVWMKWLVEEHIPVLMATGCFERYQFVHLLDVDEEDGPTYALQLYSLSMREFEKYKEKHLDAMEKTAKNKWGHQSLSFASVMEVIN